MKLPTLAAIRSLYNRLWRYRRPRAVWEAWGRSYAADPYLSKHFPQDDWLRETLTTHRAERILEVGCGTGRLLDFLLHAWTNTRRPRLVGVDFSRSMLSVARRVLGQSPGLALSDAIALPFQPKSFPWIYTHGCLMHLRTRDAVRGALQELCRVAADGFVLIEETPPVGSELPYPGFTPNGLAYYWDYEALLSETGCRVLERRHFRNIETVGCWVVGLPTPDSSAQTRMDFR